MYTIPCRDSGHIVYSYSRSFTTKYYDTGNYGRNYLVFHVSRDPFRLQQSAGSTRALRRVQTNLFLRMNGDPMSKKNDSHHGKRGYDLNQGCSHRLAGFDTANPKSNAAPFMKGAKYRQRIPSSLSIPLKPILVVGDHSGNRRQWVQMIKEAHYHAHDCSCANFISLSKTHATDFSLLIIDTDNLSSAMYDHTALFHDAFLNTPVIFIGPRHMEMFRKDYYEDYPEYLIGCILHYDQHLLLTLIYSGLLVYKTIQEKTAFGYSFGFPTVPMDFGNDSEAVRRLNERIGELAVRETPIFIEAEPGSHPDIVAMRIHNYSSRESAPFGMVPVHFGFRELYEPRLFGIEPNTHEMMPEGIVGQIELMSNGTLLIDNFHCMYRPTQDRLLSYLETKMIFRINARKAQMCDTRIFVSSINSPEELAEEGSFSTELLDLFKNNTIRIPPLREHPEVIPAWIDVFSQWIAEPAADKEPPRFTSAAVEKMMRYPWPGNTDEFLQLMRGFVYSCHDGPVDANDIVFNKNGQIDGKCRLYPCVGLTLKDMEKSFILETLKFHQGNKSATARTLGITDKTLYNKLQEYGKCSSVSNESSRNGPGNG